MRISEITDAGIAEYIRLDEDDIPRIITPIREAVIAYMKSYTGMTEEELDLHEEFYPAFMVLCQDMYDNRSMYAGNANVNKVVDSILGMHRKNLI